MKPILFAWLIVALFLTGCGAILTDCYVFTTVQTIETPAAVTSTQSETTKCDITHNDAQHIAQNLTSQTRQGNVSIKQQTTFKKK